jgi:hypothetical protein
MDPRDGDTDGDGVEDGDEGAGTVASFDGTSGQLVIDLFGGDTLTGTVTPDTEIECANDDDVQPDDRGEDHGVIDDDNGDDVGDDSAKLARRDHGDDDNSGPSDNSGPGHDGADDNDDNDDEAENEDCDASALVAGAVIREAEARVTADGLVFEEIELK